MIDYEREDFTRNGQTYDVVLDAVGKHSFLRCRAVARARRASTWRPTASTTSRSRSSRGGARGEVVFDFSGHDREASSSLKELFESGRYRPIIDRTYPLEDVVEATRTSRAGRRPATSSSR